MKRVLAILILLFSGTVIAALAVSPGDVFAGDDQFLVIPDVRDDLIAEEDGGPSDGVRGDPDDGLDDCITDSGDALDQNSTISNIGDVDLLEIWFYLMSSVWLVP